MRSGRRSAFADILAIMVVIMTSTLLFAQQGHRDLTLYKTVGSAACSDDVTVWINPAAKTYYIKGDKLYGKTKPGGYNCRKQAEAAGYRASRSQ